MDDLDVIRFVAMEIITGSEYHTPIYSQRQFFEDAALGRQKGNTERDVPKGAESTWLILVRWNARIIVCDKKAGAGKAGFGFLKFGDVEGRDVEAASGDAGAGARERCGENDRVVEDQSIGSVRLGGIDVDPFVGGERRGVEPGAVGDERVAAKRRDGGFEMQAAGDRNGDDFIVVRRKDGGKLADAFGVAPPGQADENFSVAAQDIAAFEYAGQRNVFELSKLG